MLEMEPEGCAVTNMNSTRKAKRVSFAPYASQIKLPALEEDVPSTWYEKEEMQNLARKDVQALMAQSKAGTTTPKDNSICARGWEMYLEGQLAFRQRRRKAFTKVVIQKQEVLKTLYGDDKTEAAEALREYAELRSNKCRAEAQALGVQDALDVAKDASSKSTADHMYSTDGSSRSKQMMTMRNTCIIRAA